MFDFLKMAILGDTNEPESRSENRNFEVKVSGSLSGTYQVNGCNNWLQAANLVMTDMDSKYGKQPHTRLEAKEN